MRKCKNCSRPAASGRLYCQKYLSTASKRQRIERVRKSNKGLCHSCPNKAVKGKRLCSDCNLKYLRKRRAVKIKVLINYGKCGKMLCVWRNCTVSDPDILTIDHINDNGHQDRPGGHPLYLRFIANNFPSGFQTLCMNHQFKKQSLRYRSKSKNK